MTSVFVLLMAVIFVLTRASESSANVTEDLFYGIQNPDMTLQNVKALIRAGADVTAYDLEHGDTVLMWAAAKTRDPEVIRVLVNAGARVNKITKEDGFPLLMAVGFNNRPTITQALINAGADVNLRTSNGWTALMSLVSQTKPNLNILQILIDAGANVNVRNRRGDNAILLAAGKTRNPELIRMLAKAGADMNEPNEDVTPLKAAVMGNPNPEMPDVVAALIEGGADVKKTDSAGFTPLHFAGEDRSIESMRELYRAGLLDVEDFDSALTALSSSYLKAVRVLVEAGADVNARSNDGSTVLMCAAMYGNPGVVHELVNAGADVNAKDNLGNTALMRAVEYNDNTDMISALIDAGADVNAVNNSGLDAFKGAIALKKTKHARAIKSAGSRR